MPGMDVVIMDCINCGTRVNPNQKFCSNCGTRVQTMESQQPVRGSPYASRHTPASNCLWCGQNAGFKEEEGKLDSKWGMTAHRVKLYICNNCGFVHQFGLGRTIFDFD